MIAFLGWLVAHAVGAGLRQALTRCGWRAALSSPSSAWFAIAAAYLVALGAFGLGVLAVLGLAWKASAAAPGEEPGTVSPASLLGLGLLVLARPWVPTEWDEFVWLAKARFESLGFGAGVAAALDPAQRVIPAGYPPLWPAAVGWLSLGHDSLATHVVAASLLVLLCLFTALESIDSTRPRWLAVAVLASAPLAWVHVRSTYVDLPIGLLGLALFGLLRASPSRPPLLAAVLAVVLTGFKDEGLAQVLAASAAVLLLHGPRARLLIPAVAAVVSMATWRWLVHLHGVPLFDHALGPPQWDWVPRLFQLGALHAADVFSWGLSWAVTLAVLLSAAKDPTQRALKLMLVLLALFASAALLGGPERVRVFAESGTLLNRLLLQLWPTAALLVLRGVGEPSTGALTGRGA